MEYVKLMLKYYANTASRSFRHAAKNWPVMFVLIVYFAIITFTVILASHIYILGSIIITIIFDACISSYLYLIENIIFSGTANLNDFKNSFTPYLRRIMNISVFIWLASIVYGYIMRFISGSIGSVINIIVYLVVLIFLNPLPEIVYQTNSSDMDAFYSSYEFIKDNAIEWLLPNAVFFAFFYYLLDGGVFYTSVPGIATAIKYIAGLAVFLFVMIFRGLLFRFLNSSTRRSRLFKLKMMN